MIVWLYIAIVLLMRVVQSVFGKLNANGVPKNALAYLKYNIFYIAVAGLFALCLFVFEAIGFSGEWQFSITLLYAFISGVALAVACCCSLYALTAGTMVLDSLFGTAGLLVPTVASIFLYDEILSVWQWLFVGVFLVGAYLLVGNSKKNYGKFTPATLIVLIVSLLSNGVTMLMQTAFSRSVEGGSIALFSVLSFFSGVALLGVVFIVLSVWYKRKKSQIPAQENADFTLFPLREEEGRVPKKNLLFSTGLAVAVFLINQLATVSANLISPVVLFAFINGGATIISALVGLTVFKEKISFWGAVGLVLGIGSLVMIKVFAL